MSSAVKAAWWTFSFVIWPGFMPGLVGSVMRNMPKLGSAICFGRLFSAVSTPTVFSSTCLAAFCCMAQPARLEPRKKDAAASRRTVRAVLTGLRSRVLNQSFIGGAPVGLSFLIYCTRIRITTPSFMR